MLVNKLLQIGVILIIVRFILHQFVKEIGRRERIVDGAVYHACGAAAAAHAAEGRRYTQDITDDLIVTDNRTAFQQRVSLLLDNALEYSLEGGEISLTAHPVEKLRLLSPIQWTQRSI